jgi:hypothetical protein
MKMLNIILVNILFVTFGVCGEDEKIVYAASNSGFYTSTPIGVEVAASEAMKFLERSNAAGRTKVTVIAAQPVKDKYDGVRSFILTLSGNIEMRAGIDFDNRSYNSRYLFVSCQPKETGYQGHFSIIFPIDEKSMKNHISERYIIETMDLPGAEQVGSSMGGYLSHDGIWIIGISSVVLFSATVAAMLIMASKRRKRIQK